MTNILFDSSQSDKKNVCMRVCMLRRSRICVFCATSEKHTSISTTESAGFSRGSLKWHFHHSLSCFEESYLGIEPENKQTNQTLPNPTRKRNPELLVGMSLGELKSYESCMSMRSETEGGN